MSHYQEQLKIFFLIVLIFSQARAREDLPTFGGADEEIHGVEGNARRPGNKISEELHPQKTHFCFNRWIVLVTIILMATFGGAEIFGSNGCRSMQIEDMVFSMNSYNSFYLSLDVDLHVTQEMTGRYKNAKDDSGVSCTATLEKRFNASLADFQLKMKGIERERDMLTLYLTDESFLGKAKREIGALVLAVVVSLANAIATSLNVVLTQSSYRELNARMELLSHSIAELQKNQQNVQNNIEYLHSETEFLGLSRNIITDHLNILTRVHSCEILKVDMSTRVAQFETYLSSLLDVIYEKKLSHSLIERDVLDKICSTSLFDGSIYRISPSLLYELARVDFITLENEVVVLRTRAWPASRQIYQQIYFKHW